MAYSLPFGPVHRIFRIVGAVPINNVRSLRSGALFVSQYWGDSVSIDECFLGSHRLRHCRLIDDSEKTRCSSAVSIQGTDSELGQFESAKLFKYRDAHVAIFIRIFNDQWMLKYRI